MRLVKKRLEKEIIKSLQRYQVNPRMDRGKYVDSSYNFSYCIDSFFFSFVLNMFSRVVAE